MAPLEGRVRCLRTWVPPALDQFRDGRPPWGDVSGAASGLQRSRDVSPSVRKSPGMRRPIASLAHRALRVTSATDDRARRDLLRHGPSMPKWYTYAELVNAPAGAQADPVARAVMIATCFVIRRSSARGADQRRAARTQYVYVCINVKRPLCVRVRL